MSNEFVAIAACAACALVVAAGYIINRQVWHWCPRCRHYHNECGERDRAPLYGRIEHRHLVCKDCAARARYDLPKGNS